jgi:hypothetical protein
MAPPTILSVVEDKEVFVVSVGEAGPKGDRGADGATGIADVQIGGDVISGVADNVLYIGAGPILAQSSSFRFDGTGLLVYPAAGFSNPNGVAATQGASRFGSLSETSYAALSAYHETHTATGSTAGIYGIVESFRATGTVAGMVGVAGDAYMGGAAAITVLSGIGGFAQQDGGGAVAAMSALRAYTNVRTAGTVTLNAGLYIEEQSGVGTNNYQIYSAGLADSFFAGNVVIERADPNNPVAMWVRNTGGLPFADAVLFLETTDATSGDPEIIFWSGSQAWTLGVDKSDANSFCLSTGTDFVDEVIRITTNGTDFHIPQRNLLVERTSGTLASITVNNTSAVGTPNSALIAAVAGDLGDPMVQWKIPAGNNFAQGIDNSDSDALVTVSGTTLGVNNLTRLVSNRMNIYPGLTVGPTTGYGAFSSAFFPVAAGTSTLAALNPTDYGSSLFYREENNSGTATYAVSVYGVSANEHPTGTMAYVAGIEGDAYQIGNGNVDRLEGVSGYVEKRGTGTATVMASLRAIMNARTAGTVGLNAGVYVDDQVGIAGAGKDFGIYNLNNNNYFGPAKATFGAYAQGFFPLGAATTSWFASRDSASYNAAVGGVYENTLAGGGSFIYCSMVENAAVSVTRSSTVWADAYKQNSGDINELSVFNSYAEHGGSGTVGVLTGFIAQTNGKTGGGTVTLNAGVYIQNQAGVAGAGKDFGIYNLNHSNWHGPAATSFQAVTQSFFNELDGDYHVKIDATNSNGGGAQGIIEIGAAASAGNKFGLYGAAIAFNTAAYNPASEIAGIGGEAYVEGPW